MNDFGVTAKGLARNPIGVVALFLALIYGLATLLLGTAGQTLSEAQRWPFVWFLILFPVLILIAFVFLVVFHHEKLYAPSEFRDERHFFRKLAPDEQKARLNEEVTAIERAAASSVTASPEQYRSLSREEVKLKVSVAEDMALRALEQELSCSISREVAVEAGDGWLNLDGAVVRGDELLAIEIKHFQGRGLAIFQIEHLLELLTKLPFKRFRRASLLLAIVSDAGDEADREIEQKLRSVISRFGVPVRIRFFRLAELKDRFGLGT
jgi:hypothetical protein